MKKTLLFIAASLITLSAHAEDKFLAGYLNACEHPKAYQTFQKNLCVLTQDKDGAEHCKLGSVTLPPNVATLVKSNKLTNQVEHTLFEVKLNPGLEFAKNKIIGLDHWSGHSNGIWGSALVVDSKDVKSVNQKIKASGLKIKTLKNTEIGDIGMTVAKGDDGYVRLVCDMSN